MTLCHSDQHSRLNSNRWSADKDGAHTECDRENWPQSRSCYYFSSSVFRTARKVRTDLIDINPNVWLFWFESRLPFLHLFSIKMDHHVLIVSHASRSQWLHVQRNFLMASWIWLGFFCLVKKKKVRSIRFPRSAVNRAAKGWMNENNKYADWSPMLGICMYLLNNACRCNENDIHIIVIYLNVYFLLF